MPLLLDRRRLGVALRDDDPAQIRAMLARHVLPCSPALVLAEVHDAAGVLRRKEDAPPIVGHLHVVEVRPPARLDADRRAEVNVEARRALGSNLAPPLQIVRLPM